MFSGQLLSIYIGSAKGLQSILNWVESFCENADLDFNLEKTKVNDFNNDRGKSLNNFSFR